MPYWIASAPTGREFDARDALADLGITAIVPRQVNFLRQASKRWPEPVTTPALPNYIFLSLTDHQWHTAARANLISRTAIAISDAQWQTHILRFAAQTETDYADRLEAFSRAVAERKAARAAQRAAKAHPAPIPAYNPGEVLRITAGPLLNQIATFSRMIQDAETLAPIVEAEINIMGTVTRAKLPIAAVRKE